MSLIGSPVFRGEMEMSEDVQKGERVPQQSGSMPMTVSFRCAISVTHAGMGRDNVHYIYMYMYTKRMSMDNYTSYVPFYFSLQPWSLGSLLGIKQYHDQRVKLQLEWTDSLSEYILRQRENLK